MKLLNNKLSTVSVLTRVLFIIIVVEILIMFLLPMIDIELSVFEEAILDALLLATISTPFLYWWVINSFIDATLQSEKKLLEKERHLLEAQKIARAGSWQLDHLHNKLECSNEIYSIFDIDPAAFNTTYSGFIQRIHPDEQQKVNEVFNKALQDHIPFDVDTCLLTEGGVIKWVHVKGETVFDDNGKPVKTVGIIIDHTEQKVARDQIEIEKNKAQQYLDIVGVIVVVINVKGEVILVNRKGCEILQQDEPDILGKNWFNTYIPERSRDQVKQVFEKIMQQDKKPAEYYENTIVLPDGQERLIAWHNHLILDENENITGSISSGEDVTEKRLSEHKLRQSKQQTEEALASLSELTLKLQTEASQRQDTEKRLHQVNHIDQLTQLPNRSCLKEIFMDLLKDNEISKSRMGFLLLHIDDIDLIRAQHGLNLADAVLVETSIRIQDSLTESCLISRISGVGFLVLIRDCKTTTELQALAKKILSVVNQPLETIAGKTLVVSTGISIYPEHSSQVDELIDKAFLAMKQSQAQGKNQIVVYD